MRNVSPGCISRLPEGASLRNSYLVSFAELQVILYHDRFDSDGIVSGSIVVQVSEETVRRRNTRRVDNRPDCSESDREICSGTYQ